jgi:hypothetical protein
MSGNVISSDQEVQGSIPGSVVEFGGGLFHGR